MSMKTINETSALELFCKQAQSNTFITIDTEFIRETTYWPELCLIQVATENEAVLIDPLSSGLELYPLFELLRNENVTKVFHSARQDIEIFYHLTGELPNNLFDTQIAAMVCGFGASIGYEALVQKYTKAKIDKSSRYTNWAQRPLSQKQQEYAISDVTHLRTIYQKLHEKITTEDRYHWLEDELKVLNDPNTYSIDPYSVWQKVRVRSPKPRMLAILRELAAWREMKAQQMNVPRGRVLRDDVLVELSAAAPTNSDELNRMRGLTSNIVQNEASSILEKIKVGKELPIEDCPKTRRIKEEVPGVNALIEMLKLLLIIKADKYHVAAKMIATSDDLEEIARSQDPQVPALEGWRNEVFGEAAMKLKRGEVAIGIVNDRISLIEVEKLLQGSD